MAPSVTTLLTMARTGTRVARFLIRPAGRGPLHPDGWGIGAVSPALALRRAGSRVRRAAGLGVLTVIGLLGLSILTLCTVFLGVGLASGSDSAGWVLGLVLLLGVAGATWLTRRARTLLRPDDSLGAVSGPTELPVLTTLHRHARALPASDRAVYRRTLAATAQALRVCDGDQTLGRDTFDARQAAREDLPALLGAYRAAPATPDSQREFARQLALIETRMTAIVRGRTAQQARDLQAHGRYLDDKYGRRDDDSGH